MKIDVISIFPDYFAPLQLSLVGKAIKAGLLDIQVHDLRDWTHDRHRTVDDTPYGGGAGMVMKPEPWGAALDQIALGKLADSTSVNLGLRENQSLTHQDQETLAAAADAKTQTEALLIVPTPSGRPFSQALADEWQKESHLIFACGRYEGIDARVVADAQKKMRVLEVSLGDYVLNGGEVAVLAMIEAVVRLIPGVIGNPESLVEESHSASLRLLEYPVYTKPALWRGLAVPEVLLSGNHGEIAKWRLAESQRRTQERRPDLLAKELSDNNG